MKRETEYFIVIAPPGPVCDYVKQLKNFCKRNIGSFYSAGSRAHISFGKFIDEENSPGQMSGIMRQCLHLMEKGISRIPPCNIMIDGFRFFDHGPRFKTIYAAVKLDEKTLDWFNAVGEQLLIDRDITPHITIARKIPVESFNVLWPHFKDLKFKESFS
ncbi:MAG TPA: hypothetical protein VHC47_03190, partial [Mucilaginibacter sp.]|nr:hypothetical protein [Mucilaginibacter sp.]